MHKTTYVRNNNKQQATSNKQQATSNKQQQLQGVMLIMMLTITP